METMWAVNVSEPNLAALHAMPVTTRGPTQCLELRTKLVADAIGKYHHRYSFLECAAQESDLPHVLIVGAVSPQVHPLLLLEDAAHLLQMQGVLVLLLEQGQELARMLDWSRHLEAMALRLGWSCSEATQQLWKATLTGSLLCFCKSPALPRWKVEHVREEHHAEVSALFEHVFAHPMSTQL